MAELPQITTWHVTDDGMAVYAAGKLVAVIRRASFERMIVELATVVERSAGRSTGRGTP